MCGKKDVRKNEVDFAGARATEAKERSYELNIELLSVIEPTQKNGGRENEGWIA